MALLSGTQTFFLVASLIASLIAIVVAIVVLSYLGQTRSADEAHARERQFIRVAMGIQLALFLLLGAASAFLLVEHARDGQRGKRVMAALRAVRA